MRPVRNRLRALLRLAAACLAVAGLSGCANGVFYQPSRRMWPSPDTRGLAYREVTFRAADDTRLEGWWLPAQGEVKGVVLHFHGNAQNRSTHVSFTEWLPAEGYELLIFDYRGYAGSAGAPTRRGLVMDGVAALALAAARAEECQVPLLVWGQSLGGTVALQALAKSPVQVEAAVIDSTFTSHVGIAVDKLRELPWFLRWLRLLRPLLISRGWDAEDVVGDLKDTRLFFLHGSDDRVIPASHSERLHALAPEGAELWVVEGARHCDAVLRFPGQVRPRILDFFAGQPLRPLTLSAE